MRILVAGDYCPQYRVEDAFEDNNFQIVLSDVKSVVSQADYSIVNFECPVMNDAGNAICKLGPNLCCSDKGIEALKWAGFDCVTLANNHFMDYDEKGAINTIDVCRRFNIDTVGGGKNLKDASRILYKEIEGQKIAIINCCEHEFSIATDSSAGSNPLNPIQQYYAINEAKMRADKVLMIVHGGHEYYQLPSPRMVETYRFFIDAGADAVVNHHQHCFSGYEIYKEKLIFYGLGNLCFDSPVKREGSWTEGYMVMIDYESETSSFEIYPYRQCAGEPRIEILQKEEYNEKIKELNAISLDPGRLNMAIDKYYSECENVYSDILEPIRNRYYLGAKRRGWLPSLIGKRRKLAAENYINCEAPRDKLLFWFFNNRKHATN